MINSTFEVIILQRLSLFGFDFSFTNLTLFMAIFLGVIVVLSTLKPHNLVLMILAILVINFDISNDFDILMLSLLRVRSNTLVQANKKLDVLVRTYTNPVAMAKVIVTNDLKTLNNWADKSKENKLIDPGTGEIVPPHNLDLMYAIQVKLLKISTADLIKNFDIESYFQTFTKYKINIPNLRQQLLQHQKTVIYQRTNTITEIVCTKVIEKKFKYIKHIDMTWGKPPLNGQAKILTGNTLPDYACSLVFSKGKWHQYHADLKIKTLASLESQILRMHPNSMVLTNFYWLKDAKTNHVVKGIVKVSLEDSYHQLINFYAKIDPKLANEMAKSTISAFGKFRKTGKLSDYNAIKLNFIFTEWITKFI